MKICVVVPFYNHERAISAVVERIVATELHCFLVDDGSAAHCQPVLAALAVQHKEVLTLLRLPANAGKGAATAAGFAAALAAGYSHAVQVDADGQHAVEDVPRFLAAAHEHPDAVIAGEAVFGADVPKSRLYGRYLTHAMVWLNTLSFGIRDSMCGFRLYPLAPALAAWGAMRAGRRMDFDSEILVRLHWAGVPVVNLPTAVRYPEDGVSHFDLWRDNLRISAMHTRLLLGMLRRLPKLLARKWSPST
jgi:glycosyltransferase involved in cell wall biosynthesis